MRDGGYYQNVPEFGTYNDLVIQLKAQMNSLKPECVSWPTDQCNLMYLYTSVSACSYMNI